MRPLEEVSPRTILALRRFQHCYDYRRTSDYFIMSAPAFTFLHCADLHLDTPFRGLEAMEPAIAKVLQRAGFQAFETLVERALEAEADFAVVAGDAYDGENPGLWAQLRFRESLARLAKAGVPCFLAHGNHDPAPSWQAGLRLPMGVERFSSASVESFPVERDGRLLARVYGVSYGARKESRDLASLFGPPPSDAFSVAVLHANVGAVTSHGAYAATTLETLRHKGYSYWALGHVHRRQVLLPPAELGAPVVVYPGFLQGRSARELGPGGGYLVRVAGDGAVSLEFVPCDQVRWEEVEVPLGGCPSREALLDELLRCRELSRRQAGGRPVVLRMRLTGRSALHRVLRDTDQAAALAEALREGEAERQDFVWVESLEASATAPLFDLSTLESRPDLAGAAAREGCRRKRSSKAAAEVRARLEALPEAARIAEELAQLDDEDLLSILDEATTRAVELLL